ncbi:hypothetical protein DES40_1752 [Litorimonas taeanensis]|uniref:Uncharacterized protein n=1 Tax=Litorimonas taeanensis TaxID=568099 RepID=A0A420WDB1_9PROT|nr:hypothetical protein [Litorimonas taeanensis]RKQ68976.1 hypothetical protein DES40_1752 [Litorimonas taeanensis]
MQTPDTPRSHSLAPTPPIRLGLPDYSAPRFTARETASAEDLIAAANRLTSLIESALLENRLWNKTQLRDCIRDIGLKTTILCRHQTHPVRTNGECP